MSRFISSVHRASPGNHARVPGLPQSLAPPGLLAPLAADLSGVMRLPFYLFSLFLFLVDQGGPSVSQRRRLFLLCL